MSELLINTDSVLSVTRCEARPLKQEDIITVRKFMGMDSCNLLSG